MTPSLPVYSLICRRDLASALVCLRTFVDHCKDNIRLILVSDGSLSPDELDQFRAAVPTAAVVDRPVVAAAADPLVAGHPQCQAFRKIHGWALKLIDIPLHAAGDFAFVDSDVLFMRDFTGLDRREINDVDLAFMRSYANIYSFNLPQRLTRWGGTALADRCNTGLLFVRPAAFDLDLVERFLAQFPRHSRVLLAEQTGWAALAARSRSGYFSPKQVRFPFHPSAATEQAVAYHFVGGSRHLIPEYAAPAAEEARPRDAPAADQPAVLTVHGSQRLRLHSQAYDLLRHRMYQRRWRRAGLFQ